MLNKTKKTVPIVSDGAIGTPTFLDGRIITVLVLDCADHQDLENLIQVHKHTPPGDVVSRWEWSPIQRRRVFLRLAFKAPVETTVLIAFEVKAQGVLVQSIINARAVYLQPLSSGARVSEGLGKPKILVEVPAESTFPIWQSLYRKSLAKDYKKKGLSGSQAREAARQHVSIMHDVQFRRLRGDDAE